MKMIQRGPYVFQTFWVERARKWEATSIDIPGFFAEAPTYNGLNQKIDRMVFGLHVS